MTLPTKRGKPYKNNVGRRQRWFEAAEARLPAGTLARIKAVLRAKEYQTDFLWKAIERELVRREKATKKKKAAPG
jgi:hypothetical protein